METIRFHLSTSGRIAAHLASGKSWQSHKSWATLEEAVASVTVPAGDTLEPRIVERTKLTAEPTNTASVITEQPVLVLSLPGGTDETLWLQTWREHHANEPFCGDANLTLKNFLQRGIGTLADCLDAVSECEKKLLQQKTKAVARDKRHARQVWVKPYQVPTDGQVITSIKVWQPGREQFELTNVRFVKHAARGKALYHVMCNYGREVGGGRKMKRTISEKVGSFVEC